MGMASTALAFCGGCALFVTKKDPDLTVKQVSGEFQFEPSTFPALEHTGGSVVVKVIGMDDKVLVFRRPDGTLAALSTTCTHRGCDVDYNGERDRIVCPCHGSEYGVGGKNLKGPAEKPLRAYAVDMTGKFAVVRLW